MLNLGILHPTTSYICACAPTPSTPHIHTVVPWCPRGAGSKTPSSPAAIPKSTDAQVPACNHMVLPGAYTHPSTCFESYLNNVWHLLQYNCHGKGHHTVLFRELTRRCLYMVSTSSTITGLITLFFSNIFGLQLAEFTDMERQIQRVDSIH